jgi:hypothetical protein
MHRDCRKRHGFCEKKEPQKPRPLWQPVKLALCLKTGFKKIVMQ